MVPADVHAVARSVWIRGDATDDEHNAMSLWATRKWIGTPIPKDHETLAIWIVSIAIQDGVVGRESSRFMVPVRGGGS